MTATTLLDSPVGPLRAVMQRDADGDALVALSLPAQQIAPPPGAVDDAAPFAALRDWLAAYFAGSDAPGSYAVNRDRACLG